jgi:hypothetical protein
LRVVANCSQPSNQPLSDPMIKTSASINSPPRAREGRECRSKTSKIMDTSPSRLAVACSFVNRAR